MLAGPPAFRPLSKLAPGFFLRRPENGATQMTFKHKLAVRLALLKDALLRRAEGRLP